MRDPRCFLMYHCYNSISILVDRHSSDSGIKIYLLFCYLKFCSVLREREGRLAALNAQHELHIQELQKKIQQKVRDLLL